MRQLTTLLIATAVLLTACGIQRGATVVEVPSVSHDTLYQTRLHFDSIFVDNWHYVDRAADTVVIHERCVEHHYRLLHDTVRVVQVDSVTVVKEVPVKRAHRTRISTIIAFLSALVLIGVGCFGVILRGAVRG